jgi:fructokinase
VHGANSTVARVPNSRLTVVAGEALIDLVPARAAEPAVAAPAAGDALAAQPGNRPDNAAPAAGGTIAAHADDRPDDGVPAASRTLAAHPGGGPFNTARALGRLGLSVAYLGRLSNDRFGDRLAALLAGDGVLLDAVVRTDDPTTLALAEVGAGGHATYRFYDRGTSAPGLTEADALAAPTPAYLHVGTLGLVLEPMAAALEALVDRLAGNALVMLDPNIRPALPVDRARLARVLAGADVVKVSDDDLAWLSPGTPPVEAARGLLDGGPSVVLLTRGPGGAVAVTRSGATEVPAPAVDVIDTIGAGDAFSGGWLGYWSEHGHGRAELADNEEVLAATQFACLVAALTCARAGASPPRRDEVA